MAAKAGVDRIHWVKRTINSTLFLQDMKKRGKLLKFLSLKLHQKVKEEHPYLPAPPKILVTPGAFELLQVVTGMGPEYPARIRKADATTIIGIALGDIKATRHTKKPIKTCTNLRISRLFQ